MPVFSKSKASTVSAPASKAPATRAPTGGSNSDRIAKMANAGGAQREGGDKEPRFTGALRGAKEIEASGVLADFQALGGKKVPESELDRTVEDDAVLVQQSFAKMSAEDIADAKEEAYNHPDVARDLEDALEIGFYGSDRHRQYGAIIEKLTGGVISAEEAMAMNPTGGIPGANAREIPTIFSRFGPVARHAQRHDAVGFLKTRFDAGPGYGSKTSAIGLQSDNPLAGQFLGIAREMNQPSDLGASDHVATSGRFNTKKKR